MRFTLRCPRDGVVEVRIEDVDNVVLRSGSDIEVTFECPVCGTHIVTRGQVPPALRTMLGGTWVGVDPGQRRVYGLAHRNRRCRVRASQREHAHIESYVEYFRRELDSVDTVDAMLAQMDAETAG